MVKKIRCIISFICAAAVILVGCCPVMAQDKKVLKSLTYSFDYGTNQTVDGFNEYDLSGSYSVNLDYFADVFVNAVCEDGCSADITYSKAKNLDSKSGNTTAFMLCRVTVTDASGSEYVYEIEFNFKDVYASITGADDAQNMTVNNASWTAMDGYLDIKTDGENEYVVLKHSPTDAVRMINYGTKIESLEANSVYIYEAKINMHTIDTVNASTNLTVYPFLLNGINTAAMKYWYKDNSSNTFCMNYSGRPQISATRDMWQRIKTIVYTDESGKMCAQESFFNDESYGLTQYSPAVKADRALSFSIQNKSYVADKEPVLSVDDAYFYKTKKADINEISVNGDLAVYNEENSAYEAKTNPGNVSLDIKSDIALNKIEMSSDNDANYFDFDSGNDFISIGEGETKNLILKLTSNSKVISYYNLTIKAADNAVSIMPAKNGAKSIVSMTFDDGNYESGQYFYNDIVVAKAKENNPNGDFAYWECDGQIVSCDKTYKFFACRDLTVNSVYGADNQSENVLVMANPVMADENKIAFFAERNISKGFEIIETGILLNDTETFDIENAKIKAAAKSTAHKGQFTIRKGNVAQNQTWYAKAYVIYRSTDGSVNIIYSNLVSKTAD